MLRDVLFAVIAILSPVLLLQWYILRKQEPVKPDAWIDDLERVLCDGGEGQTKE